MCVDHIPVNYVGNVVDSRYDLLQFFVLLITFQAPLQINFVHSFQLLGLNFTSDLEFHLCIYSMVYNSM